MKIKLMLAVTAVIVLAVTAFAAWHATHSDETTSRTSAATTPIPVGSTSVIAKRHAGQGSLPTCLTKSTSAEAAVRADDATIVGPDSAFDLATTMGIIDIPAGTNVDEFIHSYDGKTVTGSIAYPKQYGTYNFTIVPSSKTKPYQQWTMTSLVACT